jgi:hypothetical protein
MPDDTRPPGPEAVALTGWFSFADGEITAGDLLALEAVRAALDERGLAYETFWSPGFHPEGPSLDRLRAPAHHSHMVFVCGPAHGEQVERLHLLFAHSVRIAVNVSVIDPAGPAVRGFDRVIARDAPRSAPAVDLSAAVPLDPPVPVAGVILTTGQGEYGDRRLHERTASTVRHRLAAKDAALVPLETRLSTTDWDLPSTAAQFDAVVRRMDVVVTNRLHGLVLALRLGVPVLGIDPVAGGAKVSAQGRACRWPAVLAAEEADTDAFDTWWDWCLTEGREVARERRRTLASDRTHAMTAQVTEALLTMSPRVR